MDQQLDESLSLDDGAIGIEFNGEQEVVTTSDCSFDVSNTNFKSEIDEEMELGQIRDDHEMETENQIIDGEEYIHDEYDDSTTHNMPILAGEDGLADQTQVNLKMGTQANMIQLPDLGESIREVIPSELITPKVVSKVSSLSTSALGQSFSIQTFRVASNSSLKPVSIAPKPITMSSSVKKISLSDLQARSNRILGGELSGRQVVVVPSGGARLKVVGGVGVSGVVRAPSPSAQLLQLRQRPAPPLTKLTLTPGSVAVQKNAPARYISIQQAQQMGLLAGGKITQLVAVSPTKQPVATSTPIVRPIRQNLISSMKSPTKILPAPPQTSAGKVILTGGSQSVVIRSAPSNKPAKQVIKMEGSTGTLLASIPAGQKINPQQIHQINIPGKGVQYVRLLPASGLNQNKASSSATPSSPGGPPATLALASPSKATKVSTPQILPKTFLITDFQSNVMQVVPSKGQSIINTSSAPHTLQKFVGKTQTKHAPVSMNMTSAIHKINDTAAPLTFTLAPSQSAKAQPAVTMLSIPERVQKLEIEIEEQQEEVITSPENIKEEMSSSNDMPDQEMVEEEVEDSPQLQSPSSPGPAMEPKHIVMLPASYRHQIQPRPVAINKSMQMTSSVEIKEELSEYNSKFESALEFGLRPRKPCNCTKSQCLKLYCDCFANGEFCNQCNCNNCFNNLENEEYRQKAIRSCLDRNPNAFRPKIGKAKNNLGPEVVRRHNKGCNCKRSGCLKNYCECYEGKIACSANCKCVGCRNIEDSLDKKTLRRARAESVMGIGSDSTNEQFSMVSSRNSCNILTPKNSQAIQKRQPCSIMTSDVIEAVCQCLLAQAADAESLGGGGAGRQVLEEFAHCLQDIISAAQHTKPTQVPSNVL